MSKKIIWTLNINNYIPDLTRMTMPFIKYYAEKIGAEFRIIDRDEFPGMSASYNKLQIYKYGRGADWNIFIDADAWIHPELYDMTALLKSDECFFMANDYLPERFKPRPIFQRDGRFMSACSWFVISSRKTHDLWKPTGWTTAELIDWITPTQTEINNIGIRPDHLLDDFTLTYNMAKYHLKMKNWKMLQMAGKLRPDISYENYKLHDYMLTPEQKINQVKNHLEKYPFKKWDSLKNKYVNIMEEKI